MNTFSIKASYKRAWELFKANKKVLIVTTIIYMIAGGLGSMKGGEHRDFGIGMFIIGVILYFIGLWLQVGYYKTLLKVEDGMPIAIKEITHYGHLIWNYFVAFLLYGLVCVVGLILLVIPGLYFAIKYQFVPILVIDKKIGVRDAFKESARMTQGVKWHLVGLGFVSGLVTILGACVLIVGLLVAIPVSFLAYAHVYRILLKNEALQSPELPTV
ncbi:MAG: hypothetical protein JWL80_247 [Parcubacteria group bacterium]|nr:hypothetical protein [Parcubacteria group bacterium]